METFTLRAYLRSPIIRNGHMTLDALLMAVLEQGDVSDLLRCEDGLYLASAAHLVDIRGSQPTPFVASMRAERTPEWAEVMKPWTRSGDIAIGDKRMREGGNVLNEYVADAATAVEWYATGHSDAVLKAVQGVAFIGKRRSAGYGEVEQWAVEPGELDGLVGYLGEPLRPVPVERWIEGGDWPAVDAAWKPPYWKVESRAKCYAPSLIRLKA